MILKLKRTPGIYIVGFMGCGKTTIGQRLAEELGWTFVDIDDDIVKAAGSSIADIFDTGGEQEFRAIESECIKKRVRLIQSGRPMVVSVGGGAFAQDINYELLKENGVSIWLNCPLPLIKRRLEGTTDRPLARDPERFERLFHERQSAYARADHAIAITNNDPSATVAKILELPLF
jgi:shikimate kinase